MAQDLQGAKSGFETPSAPAGRQGAKSGFETPLAARPQHEHPPSLTDHTMLLRFWGILLPSVREVFCFFKIAGSAGDRRVAPTVRAVSKQCGISPHFSQGFVARWCRRAWIQGASGAFQPARPRAPQTYSTVRRGARWSATQQTCPDAPPQHKPCEKCGLGETPALPGSRPRKKPEIPLQTNAVSRIQTAVGVPTSEL